MPEGYTATERAGFTVRLRLRTVLPSVGAVLGMGLFTALIVYRGVRPVAAALASMGGGMAVVTIFHAAPLLANALGWHSLLRGRVSLAMLVWMRWIAESMNELLPVLQVGGNVVRARMVTQTGVAGATAGASVIVDMTLNVFTQVVFTFFGLCILLLQVERGVLVGPVILGMALMAGMVAAFYAAQRRGLFGGMARVLSSVVQSGEWNALVPSAEALDAEVRQLYEERSAIAAASAWHLLSWVLGAGDIWLALYFLGYPVSLSTALLWDCVGQAVRTAAFVIPAGLGVQEGCYIVLGSLYGLPPEIPLAVSLARRARELLLGVPGLVAWQVRGAAGLLAPVRK